MFEMYEREPTTKLIEMRDALMRMANDMNDPDNNWRAMADCIDEVLATRVTSNGKLRP